MLNIWPCMPKKQLMENELESQQKILEKYGKLNYKMLQYVHEHIQLQNSLYRESDNTPVKFIINFLMIPILIYH